MKIYEVINNMKITNCCENLIRILLALEYMCHKILINAHLKLFMKSFFAPSLDMSTSTSMLQHKFASTATPEPHTHREKRFKCSVIKNAFLLSNW